MESADTSSKDLYGKSVVTRSCRSCSGLPNNYTQLHPTTENTTTIDNYDFYLSTEREPTFEDLTKRITTAWSAHLNDLTRHPANLPTRDHDHPPLVDRQAATRLWSKHGGMTGAAMRWLYARAGAYQTAFIFWPWEACQVEAMRDFDAESGNHTHPAKIARYGASQEVLEGVSTAPPPRKQHIKHRR